MTHLNLPTHWSDASKPTARSWIVSPQASRSLLLSLAGFSVFLGLHASDPDAPFHVSSELTHLLRFMALLKAMMALALLAVVVWRLAAPITSIWLVAYSVASSAMFSGPGLIWDMDHVGVGALLLHGGLLATGVLLWRDRATTGLLEKAVDASRRRRATDMSSKARSIEN